MKILLIAILFLGFACRSLHGEDTLVKRSINSYQNKTYELTVMQSDLDKAPMWRDSEANPPLSVRAAIASAGEVVKKFPNSELWRLSSITLERAGNREGQWLYIVQFYPDQNKVLFTGYTIKIPVLLDGKTPELTMR